MDGFSCQEKIFQDFFILFTGISGENLSNTAKFLFTTVVSYDMVSGHANVRKTP